MTDEGGDFDSWEDQADSGLFDRRLDEMSVEIQQASEKKKVLHQGQMVMSDESGSTQYQPKVRILKRDVKAPPSSNDATKTGPASGASKGSKTLQQREAEYAEARMRIFGCASPDDDEEDELNSNGDKNNSSVVIQGIPQIIKPNNSTVPVIRQPRGPDGTSGFNKPDHT